MKIADAVFRPVQETVMEALEAACRTIAPTWPLDRFIAVNPYWSWVNQPFEATALQLGRLAGSRMWMPRSFYQNAWQKGQLTSAHIALAIKQAGALCGVDSVIEAINKPAPLPAALPLPSDLLDAARDLSREPAWRSTITHQVSQFCAAYFDADQADWHLPHASTLYAGWRANLLHDHGIGMLMNAPQLRSRIQSLPGTAMEAIAMAIDGLAVPASGSQALMTACLMRINGWAAWCAYLRWQARLEGRDDNHLVDLLAIRLCWEYLLHGGESASGEAAWHPDCAEGRSTAAAQPDVDALLQSALEIAYQERLCASLMRWPAQPATVTAAQAVFCIDVRSEVLRRALEAVSPEVQTMGFAGFFGLPISYQALGSDVARPQLPGLLSPSLRVTDSCGVPEQDRELAAARRARLAAVKSWQPFQRLPGSAFALVETLGLSYLAKLLRRSLPARPAPADPAGQGGADPAGLRPVLVFKGGDTLGQQADLAEKVLKAMGLRDGFARIVLLAGHGSQSANNPHAAGLDCGACCGQTGEVNARALAGLLNHGGVRALLVARGTPIPHDTVFVAGLHNTTTDEVVLFDTDTVPASHQQDLATLRGWLSLAGDLARRERAPALGMAHLAAQPQALRDALTSRSNDWAQTRPEWGLANNAAFIAAPRVRTLGINLQGRSFLHDYQWTQDADNSILELIMTAPMVVAHWINMQYYASTVDNGRYGSGNKVLHNVVGGHIGVFEGNGGDLRIGLPMQSLHDGRQWMHTPLRLSVFIEAPRERIEAVMATHGVVRQLVENKWLYLFRIDGDASAVEAFADGAWQVWDEVPEGDALQAV
jgi:uncharacterized protein YbcC (UPF0753/DUF2309 family)